VMRYAIVIESGKSGNPKSETRVVA
jgi:hypothetical protein